MKSSHWRRAMFAGAALAAASASSATAARTYPIVVKAMAFAPAPAGLRVGDAIEWVNADIFLHSATSKAGGFDVTLKPGAHVRMTLTRPGAYGYICRYHPGMNGRLSVAK